MSADRKPRILLVLNTFGIGGAERHYTELLKRIDRSRFDVSACCLWKRGELLEELKNIDMEIVDLDMKSNYWQRLPSTLYKLHRRIRQERIDIVHSYLFYSNIVGAFAGRLAGARVIVSKRALNMTWMTRKHIALNRLVNRCADRVTVVSDAVGRSVIEREKVPPRKLVCIHNGVDFEKVSIQERGRQSARHSLGIDNGVPVVGTVAHLSRKKGHVYLLEAAREVIKVFPNALFLWAGEGELEGKLQDLAKEWGLAENVRFMGYRLDVPALLEAMDVFVLPSVEEGMSNALLEAMAKGIPVIATDVGGNPEVIEHEKSGLLVPAREAVALVEALVRILRQPALATALAQAGSERVREHFSIDNTISSIECLYEELKDEAISQRRKSWVAS